MNLLSRNWWEKLAFQQIQQTLIEKGNYWGIPIPDQNLFELNVCLFGLVANPILSVVLQSLVIASNFVVEGYVNEPPYYWDYE